MYIVNKTSIDLKALLIGISSDRITKIKDIKEKLPQVLPLLEDIKKKSSKIVVTKETKAPIKETPAPMRPKRYKMLACKGSTPLANSSSSTTTPQAGDNPPEMTSPPFVNKKKGLRNRINSR
ncbi:hypothetical protein LOK49_LG03G02854 [Camellia lanceoleosa]|uniref:Uncharacterized protein n=1 Tax=Camellia lanceoleosa TaxID=1840588 RepID=A0ACC0IGP8_9ERIC|nr:hypothetical protein LOK49_LG03G02854 [Camellia lanceoleosa]